MIQGARAGLYLVVLLLALLSQLTQPEFLNWDLLKNFYMFVLAGLFLHLVPFFNLNLFFQKSKLMGLSFAIDIILISVLSLRTELHQTLFLFMYLLTIILSGIVFQSRGAFLVALLSSIGFTLGALLGPEMKSLQFLFILVLNNVAFFVVAWLSGFLAEQLDLLGEKLKAQGLSFRSLQKLNEAIVQTIPSGLLTTNLNGEILTLNLKAQELLQAKQFEGHNLTEKFPEASGMKAGESLEVHRGAGDSLQLIRVRCLNQDNESLQEQTKLYILDDLTQLRRLEFAVRQSEKMAAIGQLAAGIAHEIRNPLAGISGSVELLGQQTQTEDDRKLFKIILREIDRLNHLISEFLDFAKPEKIPNDSVDIDSVIREVLSLTESYEPKELHKKIDLESKVIISGQKDKLKQAFLNIVINALQAMSTTKNPRLEVETQKNSEGLLVRIKDNGPGMKPETKTRIFEPFMTTKPKGTGLGLAITHKILESHRAQIFVESEPDLGSQFLIQFPSRDSTV